MAFVDLFQGFLFNSKSLKTTAVRQGGQQLQVGYKETCSTCNGLCATATLMRDCGTSTHDLISYVWCTEGEGMVESHEPTIDDDEDGSVAGNGVIKLCSTCPFGRLKPCCRALLSDRCQAEMEVRAGAMCDVGTSTFDLSAYYWGTVGSEDAVGDEDMPDAHEKLFDVSTEAGFFGERGMRLAGRKRARDVVDYGFTLTSTPTESKAPPVKKSYTRRARG